MSRLLMLYDEPSATLDQLEKTFIRFASRYGCTLTVRSVNKVKKTDIFENDVVMAVRGETPLMCCWQRVARINRKTVIYYLDDDLKDIDKSSGRFPPRKKWVVKCVANSDILVTPSPLIAEEYKELLESNKVVLLNTPVPPEDIIDIKKSADDIKIVYAACGAHAPTFEKLISPILPELFDRYGDRLEIHFIGVHPTVDVGKYNDRIVYYPFMPLDDYYDHMRANFYDIGLSPLVTDHFTERKYFNKYIEYARLGICGIYSDVMPYKLVIENGVNGYFAENTPDSWLDVISETIDNRAEREAVAATAQEHLKKEFNEAKIFEDLKRDIPQLTEAGSDAAEKKWPCGIVFCKIRHRIFRLRDSIHLVFFNLFHIGFAKTVKKILNRRGRRK